MNDLQKLRRLHRRLVGERRTAFLAAAEIDAVPPSGLLARISDLDGAVAALEAVIEEGFRDEPVRRVQAHPEPLAVARDRRGEGASEIDAGAHPAS